MNKKLKENRKETLFAELYSLLSSGLDFSRAFRLLIEGEPDRSVARLLSRIYERVVAGSSLWESLPQEEGFTPLDTGVIRIGEETGRLSEALAFLSEYYTKRLEQRRIITGAVTYPLVILITAVIVLCFMITVIVPMFEQVYARMGGELPGITQSIIALSRHFPLYLSVVGGGIILLAVIRHFYGHTDRWRAVTGNLLLRFPIIGTLVRENYEARFCRLLHLLVSSGIPLVEGLQMLENIITFYPYHHSFTAICRDIREGRLFADALSAYPLLYGRKSVTLIRVGEETNRLAFMLDKLAESLTRGLEHRLRQSGHLLEPILILFVGGIVAIVLIAMYMPMSRLGTTIY